jgi:hypothetical protein
VKVDRRLEHQKRPSVPTDLTAVGRLEGLPGLAGQLDFHPDEIVVTFRANPIVDEHDQQED